MGKAVSTRMPSSHDTTGGKRIGRDGQWVPRQRQPNIGRLYFIHPFAGGLHYFRLLFNHIIGATCYDDFRRVPGRDGLCATFREACIARAIT